MADETGEVRSLLMRHRLSIVRDLIGTSLLQVLLKASVLTAAQEEQLTGEPSLDARCDQLIELIARDGFEKFKQFCYAIESECSQLISDLINDKLSQTDVEEEEKNGAGGYGKEVHNISSPGPSAVTGSGEPEVVASFAAVVDGKFLRESEKKVCSTGCHELFHPMPKVVCQFFTQYVNM
uniref:CARD domain-containing protein n=1 Tax=Anopheles epiroticus TaxID=199890 RepID=A0A182P0C5_9DIPT